jgi:hypothetical protein
VCASLLGKTLSILLKPTETAAAGSESPTTGSPRMQSLLLRLLFSHHLSLNDRWEVTDSSSAKGCGALQMVQQLRTRGPGRARNPDGVKRGTRPAEPRRPVRRARASSHASMLPACVEVLPQVLVNVRVRPEIHRRRAKLVAGGCPVRDFFISIRQGEGNLHPAGTNVGTCGVGFKRISFLAETLSKLRFFGPSTLSTSKNI